MLIRLDLTIGPLRVTIGQPEHAAPPLLTIEATSGGVFDLDGQPDSQELFAERSPRPRIGYQ